MEKGDWSAVANIETSTSTNGGDGKDSEKRQRAAIEAYAKAAGYLISSTDWFYDIAVKGADPVTARPGFALMMDRIASNGLRVIIVESPDRFARDLAVQLAGHDYLKNLGVALIPAAAETLRRKLALYLKIEMALQLLSNKARGLDTDLYEDMLVTREALFAITEPPELEEAWTYLDLSMIASSPTIEPGPRIVSIRSSP